MIGLIHQWLEAQRSLGAQQELEVAEPDVYR